MSTTARSLKSDHFMDNPPISFGLPPPSLVADVQPRAAVCTCGAPRPVASAASRAGTPGSLASAPSRARRDSHAAAATPGGRAMSSGSAAAAARHRARGAGSTIRRGRPPAPGCRPCCRSSRWCSHPGGCTSSSRCARHTPSSAWTQPAPQNSSSRSMNGMSRREARRAPNSVFPAPELPTTITRR